MEMIKVNKARRNEEVEHSPVPSEVGHGAMRGKTYALVSILFPPQESGGNFVLESEEESETLQKANWGLLSYHAVAWQEVSPHGR